MSYRLRLVDIIIHLFLLSCASFCCNLHIPSILFSFTFHIPVFQTLLSRSTSSFVVYDFTFVSDDVSIQFPLAASSPRRPVYEFIEFPSQSNSFFAQAPARFTCVQRCTPNERFSQYKRKYNLRFRKCVSRNQAL